MTTREEQRRMLMEEYENSGLITSQTLLHTFMIQDTNEIAKKIHDDVKQIEEVLKQFNRICWPDIKLVNDNEANYTTLKFDANGISLLSKYTAARILMTISNDITMANEFISVIGSGEDCKIEDLPSCGLQGLNATKDKAIELLNSIIQNWDVTKYVVYNSESVTIL